ncbi:winged helix-turn-helix domain-containing protein [Leucobacter sp. wl10]|uniref:winged helix-turn-helix domain-containing protein n=1 Tax=Leucobacter sp. wl10 TaxID=2304677 RepID=UPI000E5B3C3D|nr:hypothetical protein D1J51_01485 [Leucobacter sp. wl10]
MRILVADDDPQLVRALRVTQQESTPVVQIGAITVDLAARVATDTSQTPPRRIRLTPTEWQAIELLIRNAGRLVTRQTLLTRIRGTEHARDTGYLRLYLPQLRKKLEPDPVQPRYLLTEAGMGYRFQPEQSDG